jgi:Integrase zinc binding domain/Integrase core domain
MDENEYHRIVKNIEKENKYIVKEGLLYRIKGDKIVRVIRKYEFEGLMFMMHNHELSAHFGIKATQDKIREKYYWKNMAKDIEIYVKSCDSCQRRGKPIGKNELHPIKVREPFYQIGIDFVGPLPVTESGNKYIIVAMDYFTKWPEAKAVKTDNAKEVAIFIYEDIICRHGCPQKILSDRGTHFNNKMIEELMNKFEIKHRFSTSYHPKTNGLVERFNKTLCESLAKLGGNNNWDNKIAPVLFAYRNKRQESTKLKPFYLTYGREARMPTDNNNIPEERINQLIEELPRIRNQAHEEINKSQIKQKKYHDNKNKRKELFQIGDKI